MWVLGTGSYCVDQADLELTDLLLPPDACATMSCSLPCSFLGRVSYWHGTYQIDQADGPKGPGDPPASMFHALALPVRAITFGSFHGFWQVELGSSHLQVGHFAD